MSAISHYADELVANGVPMKSIVSLIEAHYAQTIYRLEEELREQSLASLTNESLTRKLKTSEETVKQLQDKIALSVERSTLLRNAMTQNLVRPIPEVVEAAKDAKSFDVARSGFQCQIVSLRLFSENLQNQLQQASAQLIKTTEELEKEKTLRRRFENENHVLNMQSMSLHDEISRLANLLDQTRERLKSHIVRMDDDRQTLIGTISDLKGNLESLNQRSQTEVFALQNHLQDVQSQLKNTQKRFGELQEDYLSLTSQDRGPVGMQELTNPANARLQQTPSGEVIENLKGALEEMASRAMKAEHELAGLRKLADDVKHRPGCAEVPRRSAKLLELPSRKCGTTKQNSWSAARVLMPLKEPTRDNKQLPVATTDAVCTENAADFVALMTTSRMSLLRKPGLRNQVQGNW